MGGRSKSLGRDFGRQHNHKCVYAFGSSTPRELSYLNLLPHRFRVYDVKLKALQDSNKSIGDYMQEARLMSPVRKGELRKEQHIFAFGHSTPRELAYLCTLTPEFRIYDTKLLPTPDDKTRSKTFSNIGEAPAGLRRSQSLSNIDQKKRVVQQLQMSRPSARQRSKSPVSRVAKHSPAKKPRSATSSSAQDSRGRSTSKKAAPNFVAAAKSPAPPKSASAAASLMKDSPSARNVVPVQKKPVIETAAIVKKPPSDVVVSSIAQFAHADVPVSPKKEELKVIPPSTFETTVNELEGREGEEFVLSEDEAERVALGEDWSSQYISSETAEAVDNTAQLLQSPADYEASLSSPVAISIDERRITGADDDERDQFHFESDAEIQLREPEKQIMTAVEKTEQLATSFGDQEDYDYRQLSDLAQREQISPVIREAESPELRNLKMDFQQNLYQPETEIEHHITPEKETMEEEVTHKGLYTELESPVASAVEHFDHHIDQMPSPTSLPHKHVEFDSDEYDEGNKENVGYHFAAEREEIIQPAEEDFGFSSRGGMFEQEHRLEEAESPMETQAALAHDYQHKADVEEEDYSAEKHDEFEGERERMMHAISDEQVGQLGNAEDEDEEVPFPADQIQTLIHDHFPEEQQVDADSLADMHEQSLQRQYLYDEHGDYRIGSVDTMQHVDYLCDELSHGHEAVDERLAALRGEFQAEIPEIVHTPGSPRHFQDVDDEFEYRQQTLDSHPAAQPEDLEQHAVSLEEDEPILQRPTTDRGVEEAEAEVEDSILNTSSMIASIYTGHDDVDDEEHASRDDFDSLMHAKLLENHSPTEDLPLERDAFRASPPHHLQAGQPTTPPAADVHHDEHLPAERKASVASSHSSQTSQPAAFEATALHNHSASAASATPPESARSDQVLHNGGEHHHQLHDAADLAAAEQQLISNSLSKQQQNERRSRASSSSSDASSKHSKQHVQRAHDDEDEAELSEY